MNRTNIIFSLMLLLLLTLSLNVSADTLTIKGVYQGKNLIAQNSFNPTTKAYCTREVYINNIKAGLNTNQAAFEIDLSSLSYLQAVEIKIVRNESCDFKILNSIVIDTKKNYVMPKLALSENGIFLSKMGNDNGTYQVERYEYGTWETVREHVTASTNNNDLNVNLNIQHNSGLNTYRVKFNNGSKIYYSEEIIYISKLSPVELKVSLDKQKATLSRQTAFKIIDFGGNEIKSGMGKDINITDLNAGTYFIEYDNKTAKLSIPYME